MTIIRDTYVQVHVRIEAPDHRSADRFFYTLKGDLANCASQRPRQKRAGVKLIGRPTAQ